MTARTPRFGERVLNTSAGESNPRRISYFVRVVRRRGKMNTGTWWEMTDGRGEVWEMDPRSAERLAGRGPADLDSLRRFARAIMGGWPDGGGLYYGDIEGLAVTHGLLEETTVHAHCGVGVAGETIGCACAEVCSPEDFEAGVTCYRKTALLTAGECPECRAYRPKPGEHKMDCSRATEDFSARF